MIEVVAAIIRNEEGKVLIAQRNKSKSLGGLWEFPGGKIEKGESQEQAIIREIKEELDMDIKPLQVFDEQTFEYPDQTIKLIALNCKMIGDHYVVLEHEQVVWVYPDEMDMVEFAPADRYFVEKIKEEEKCRYLQK